MKWVWPGGKEAVLLHVEELIMVWWVERGSWSWTLVRLEALCRHTTFLWLMVSLFTSCWRCSGKKKTLLYIFHVPFSYTTFFFFPPLLSPTSPFSKVPTTSTDCVHLKWEDFEVQFFLVVFIQANFLYFCGLLGATYSSIWSGKYGHSVFGLAILIL